MKRFSVGIIGLGAIGSRLVGVLVTRFRREASVDFVCDLKKARIREVQEKWLPHAQAVSWRKLVQHSDLIVEAASQAIALPVATRSLKLGKQVLILSVGGLVPWDGLSLLQAHTEGKLWIPSGALAGVDALLAASQGRLRRVTLTTHKPLKGLQGAPYFQQRGIRLSQVKGPTLVFEGSALEAVRAFPKNVNVAATLALAGLGPKATRVRIFTSPTYRENRHEVEIEGDFGRIRTEVENRPLVENPRTSQLALLSTVATLRKIFSRVSIGT